MSSKILVLGILRAVEKSPISDPLVLLGVKESIRVIEEKLVDRAERKPAFPQGSIKSILSALKSSRIAILKMLKDPKYGMSTFKLLSKQEHVLSRTISVLQSKQKLDESLEAEPPLHDDAFGK